MASIPALSPCLLATQIGNAYSRDVFGVAQGYVETDAMQLALANVEADAVDDVPMKGKRKK